MATSVRSWSTVYPSPTCNVHVIATSTHVYSDFYSSTLGNAQSELRQFLLSETAKQRAEADVHGASRGPCRYHCPPQVLMTGTMAPLAARIWLEGTNEFKEKYNINQYYII